MRHLAVLAALALLPGCAGSPTAQPGVPSPIEVSVPKTTTDDPDPTPPRVEDAAAPASITGIPSCDEYLAAYRICAPNLAAEIADGNRRAYPAEEGWLNYMKTTSEAPGLPGACQSMLTELRSACPRAPR